MKLTKILPLSMTAVMLAISLISSAQIPTIYCGVYKSTSWGTTLQRGIYSFPAQNNTTFTKVSTAENDNFLAPLGGAAVYDGVMHGVHYTSGEIYGQKLNYAVNESEKQLPLIEDALNKTRNSINEEKTRERELSDEYNNEKDNFNQQLGAKKEKLKEITQKHTYDTS